MHLKSTVKCAVVRAFVNRSHTPAIARLSLTGSSFVVVCWYSAQLYLRPEQAFGSDSVGSGRWPLGWVGSYVIPGIGLLGICVDLTSCLLLRRVR